MRQNLHGRVASQYDTVGRGRTEFAAKDRLGLAQHSHAVGIRRSASQLSLGGDERDAAQRSDDRSDGECHQ